MTEKQARRILASLDIIRKETRGEAPRRYRILNHCDKVAVQIKKDLQKLTSK